MTSGRRSDLVATSSAAALDAASLEDSSPGAGGDPSRRVQGDVAQVLERPGALASLLPSADGASSGDGGDSGVAAVPERRCLWCRAPLEVTRLRWCSKRCRQTAFRARRLFQVEASCSEPKRLGFGDPPYPGLAYRYYGKEPTYAGEVDHVQLIAQLQTYDGWALSTSADAVRDILPLCPRDARLCPWVKPNGVSSKTRGAHNTWEALIVKPAREFAPGFRDWLCAKPARGGGTLMGRKPLAFCAFLFQQLGALPIDDFHDIFPGTGIVMRAWEEFRRSAPSLMPATSTGAPC
jgi:hypothetical protein